MGIQKILLQFQNNQCAQFDKIENSILRKLLSNMDLNFLMFNLETKINCVIYKTHLQLVRFGCMIGCKKLCSGYYLAA